MLTRTPLQYSGPYYYHNLTLIRTGHGRDWYKCVELNAYLTTQTLAIWQDNPETPAWAVDQYSAEDFVLSPLEQMVTKNWSTVLVLNIWKIEQ